MLARLAVVLLLALPAAGWAYQPPMPQETGARTAIFSGIVTAVSESSVTVNRKGLGLDSVTHTFAIDAKTRIEGKLRPRAKVTVMYAATDDGMLAVRIIVR
ncbi:MAG TPA: hypothetical protein DEQ47_08915 [Solibacterales bacterium]|jgi:hypothetical protein|nr:hypothetical protein [Bryobacterales bacterium]